MRSRSYLEKTATYFDLPARPMGTAARCLGLMG
jgi:hypothetical protein